MAQGGSLNDRSQLVCRRSSRISVAASHASLPQDRASNCSLPPLTCRPFAISIQETMADRPIKSRTTPSAGRSTTVGVQAAAKNAEPSTSTSQHSRGVTSAACASGQVRKRTKRPAIPKSQSQGSRRPPAHLEHPTISRCPWRSRKGYAWEREPHHGCGVRRAIRNPAKYARRTHQAGAPRFAPAAEPPWAPASRGSGAGTVYASLGLQEASPYLPLLLLRTAGTPQAEWTDRPPTPRSRCASRRPTKTVRLPCLDNRPARLVYYETTIGSSLAQGSRREGHDDDAPVRAHVGAGVPSLCLTESIAPNLDPQMRQRLTN